MVFFLLYPISKHPKTLQTLFFKYTQSQTISQYLLVQATNMCHLDETENILLNCLVSALAHLESVLNTAARGVLFKRTSDDVAPLLKTFLWSPQETSQ